MRGSGNSWEGGAYYLTGSDSPTGENPIPSIRGVNADLPVYLSLSAQITNLPG